MVNTKIRWIMSFELKMEKFYTVSKDKTGNGLAQSKFYAP